MGYAPDYVETMHLIATQDNPDDFIMATQNLHSVEQMVEGIFQEFELDWEKYVVENSELRTRKVRPKMGTYDKLKRATGWEPKTNFSQMIKLLVENRRKD